MLLSLLTQKWLLGTYEADEIDFEVVLAELLFDLIESSRWAGLRIHLEAL